MHRARFQLIQATVSRVSLARKSRNAERDAVCELQLRCIVHRHEKKK
jgi:hypothetical protein